MTRTFDDKPATRERTPLLVGIAGPSSSGKTYSALRLAAGFQRISGGDVFCIDTEARRALHYADKFKFRHVAFGAPFGPLDYLAAVEHCIRKGATTIIIDSCSHEHEGRGGVLEMHDAETKRLAREWHVSPDVAKFSGWQKPKQERRRFLDFMIQQSCNFILCFRAKEKLKIAKGADPLPLGFLPIAGEEYVYEMTLKCLLLPGANGVPVWQSDQPGEKIMIKLPEQFRDMFKVPEQLSEDIGERLARWAAGSAAPPKVSATELIASYEACSEPATLRALEEQRRACWQGWKKDEKTTVKAAADAAAKRIAEPAADPTSSAATDETEPPPPAEGEQHDPTTGEVLEPGVAAASDPESDGR